jgi:hypothetical protein
MSEHQKLLLQKAKEAEMKEAVDKMQEYIKKK